MKVSYNWLNNYVDKKLPPVDEVADALTFHAFEIDGIEKMGSDSVLDVKVTPNRGHDCLSHRGIAKELSAILKLPMNAQYDPFNRPADFSKKSGTVSVSIEDSALCKRYIAGHIRGVNVGPSPEWLKTSLEAIGQRSINNVVDATNLVMFNLGQPLHAFDAAKLYKGRSFAAAKDRPLYEMGVRLARAGEQLEALDKNIYQLGDSTLVITAGDRPVGIAGVKGGQADRIDEETSDIVLEAAAFDGVSIRKTAQALKLRTDASARFEQVLSPELAAYGMAQAVELIRNIAGGEVEGYVDVYPNPQKLAPVAVSLGKINAVLGTSLTGAEVADVFQRLGFAYKEEGGVFQVVPPFERLDLAIAEDLVEEVGRIVGYDKVPAMPLPPADEEPKINPTFYAAEKKREQLINQGYSEVYTSVFADEGKRMVANKIGGGRPFLRESLVPGLIEAVKKNIPNKDLLGLKQIKLFEIGTVWNPEEKLVFAITDERSAEEWILEPQEAKKYQDVPVSQTQRYRPFSRYPYIVRDIALWVPPGTDAMSVQELIHGAAGELLAKSPSVFDKFQKGERLSLALRLVFQSPERTLTEKEVNAIMEKVAAALTAQGFEIR